MSQPDMKRWILEKSHKRYGRGEMNRARIIIIPPTGLSLWIWHSFGKLYGICIEDMALRAFHLFLSDHRRDGVPGCKMCIWGWKMKS